MSLKQRKSRKAYYKIARIGKDGTLSNLILKAFINDGCAYPKPGLRHYLPVSTSEDFYVLNYVSQLNGMIYGELIFIERDKYQTVIHMEVGLDTYRTTTVTVDNVNLEDIDEAQLKNYQKEFVDSTLYFGISGNHVAVIQSASLKAKQLAEYLNHMLGEHKANLLDNQIITFRDMPSQEAEEMQKKHSPRSIRISQDITANSQQSMSNGSSASFSLDGADNKLWGALAETLGLTKEQSKKLKQNIQGDNFVVDIVLRIKGQAKDVSDTGQDFLNKISASLSNLDDDDYEIQYVGGAKLTAGEFRLNKNITIEVINNGVNHINLMKDLYNFLESNLSDSKE